MARCPEESEWNQDPALEEVVQDPTHDDMGIHNDGKVDQAIFVKVLQIRMNEHVCREWFQSVNHRRVEARS